MKIIKSYGKAEEVVDAVLNNIQKFRVKNPEIEFYKNISLTSETAFSILQDIKNYHGTKEGFVLSITKNKHSLYTVIVTIEKNNIINLWELDKTKMQVKNIICSSNTKDIIQNTTMYLLDKLSIKNTA